MPDITDAFDAASFGRLYADEYDERHDPGTTAAAVELLAELAGVGRVLELAIGTGRVALPLAQRGIDIHGLDGSPQMLAKLQAKPGGADIPVTVGDMANVTVAGPFDFAFLIFNTFYNLTSQQAQLDCIASTAAQLAPGGQLLLEMFVPDISQFDGGQSVRALDVDMQGVALEVGVHDPVNQVIEYQRVFINAQGNRLMPLPMRYAWPAELDLMARLAGLSLQHRWGNWDKSPFTASSDMHISVYQKD